MAPKLTELMTVTASLTDRKSIDVSAVEPLLVERLEANAYRYVYGYLLWSLFSVKCRFGASKKAQLWQRDRAAHPALFSER